MTTTSPLSTTTTRTFLQSRLAASVRVAFARRNNNKCHDPYSAPLPPQPHHARPQHRGGGAAPAADQPQTTRRRMEFSSIRWCHQHCLDDAARATRSKRLQRRRASSNVASCLVIWIVLWSWNRSSPNMLLLLQQAMLPILILQLH